MGLGSTVTIPGSRGGYLLMFFARYSFMKIIHKCIIVCKSIYIYIYIHTYIHTYIHIYIYVAGQIEP